MRPRLLVVDASALVEYLLQTERGRRIERHLTHPDADLHVPELCDVEVVSALRGLERRGELDVRRSREGVEDYLALPLLRHRHTAFVPRTFEMRENLSPYDAMYVSLAEGLGAPFLSGDDRLTRAAGRWTDVELLDA
ncbi:MAG: type II toxin-antitoxin system VapC family toxin [Longimicrobiales bacterium]